MSNSHWPLHFVYHTTAKKGPCCGVPFRRTFTYYALVLISSVFLLSSCGDLSLHSVLGGERIGGFSLTTREVHLSAAGEFTLSADGGVAPYSFELERQVGVLHSVTGYYRAPDELDNAQVIDVPVIATDYTGATDSGLIRLYHRLTANPRSLVVEAGEVTEITVLGGVPAYDFDLSFDEERLSWVYDGQEEPWTLRYAAPEEATSEYIRVRDSIGNRITVYISVFDEDELRITTERDSLTVVLEDGKSEEIKFHIDGGNESYGLAVEKNPDDMGTLSWDERKDYFRFTVKSKGVATFIVTDSNHNIAETTLVAVEAEPEELSMSPSSVSIAAGRSVKFTADGGVLPYEFAVDRGAGNDFKQIDDVTAKFAFRDSVPPGQRGELWDITVTDAQGNTISSTVRHDTQ